MSNVIDNETGRPLADGKVHHIIEWGGRKIGLIGLVEREWLDTLATINPEEVDYTDYVDAWCPHVGQGYHSITYSQSEYKYIFIDHYFN